jgi:hypothetical protein
MLLAGCLLAIGAAGVFAVLALNGGAAGAQPITTWLRVVRDDPGGIATLATVGPTKLASGPTLPAGTSVSVPGVTLAAALAPAPAPLVGATLRCDLSVNWSASSQVIDIVTCAPDAASAR